ncbi:MAG: AbrB family transcriptional regulator [Candidatus Riflebacteria bacterium]|nr:AbrB family transcriptional regulator [Candidatus Riflebacteria bacterium]
MKSKVLWWAVIGILAAGLGFESQVLSIPGGWFVTAMLVAIVASLIRPKHPRVAPAVLSGAQAVIGVLLGINIRPEVFPNLILYFPAIMLVMVVTIGISLIGGVVLSRVSSLGRETATLGTLPGGASAMIALSLETNADARIVALMQYLRLAVVVLTSSLVAGFLTHQTPGVSKSLPGLSSGSPHSWFDLILTPFLAILGVWVGKLIRLPSANFLGPIILGLLVSGFQLFQPVWPIWVPPLAYISMGFYVGLLFDQESLFQAGRLLPLLLANTLVLIGTCALAGWAFAWFTGASPVSGYLATTPGGGDSVAIIALGTGADLSLIFSVQFVRFLLIVFTGPFLAKTALNIKRKLGENIATGTN